MELCQRHLRFFIYGIFPAAPSSIIKPSKKQQWRKRPYYGHFRLKKKRETGALRAGGTRSAPTEPEARRTEGSIPCRARKNLKVSLEVLESARRGSKKMISTSPISSAFQKMREFVLSKLY
jgi:hypothetical protein